jgi:hypothetical protein
MERLKEDLIIVSKTIWILEKGSSMRQALEHERLRTSRPSMFLREYISRGLRGEPILTALKEYQLELIAQIDFEIDRQSALLPIKALVPLLLFQFPALLILAFGPLLERLNKFV